MNDDDNALIKRKEILDNALSIENTEKHSEIEKNAGWYDKRRIRNAQTQGLISIYKEKCKAIREGVKDYYGTRVNEQRIKNENDLAQANMLYAECLTTLKDHIQDKRWTTITNRIEALQKVYIESINNVIGRADQLPQSVIDRTLKRLDNIYDQIEERMGDLEEFAVKQENFLK